MHLKSRFIALNWEAMLMHPTILLYIWNRTFLFAIFNTFSEHETIQSHLKQTELGNIKRSHFLPSFSVSVSFSTSLHVCIRNMMIPISVAGGLWQLDPVSAAHDCIDCRIGTLATYLMLYFSGTGLQWQWPLLTAESTVCYHDHRYNKNAGFSVCGLCMCTVRPRTATLTHTFCASI